MKFRIGITLLLLCMAGTALAQSPQAPIVTLSLNPDQIATVKTAQGITTRISFPDEVKEIICGDLYDPATGKGAFVVQRSDNDVFLKPLQTKGITNLFVKTGDKGQRVYNFDLVIVSAAAEAHRVVNVGNPGGATQSKSDQKTDSAPEIVTRAREQADEILKDARRQSQQAISDAEQQASTINRQAMDKAASVERLAMQHAQEIEKKFVYAIMNGLQETKVDNQRVSTKNIVITLNPKVITFDGKSYLSFTILNTGAKEFAFTTISIETGTDKNRQPIAAEVVQSKSDNVLAPGETLKGVVVFNPTLVKESDRLTMYLRGQDNVEIARANIQ